MRFDRERLLYRRQFVLGPSFLDSLSHWNHFKVGSSICISAHPDLAVHQASKDGRSLTLLGYLLDPAHPDADDSTILTGLLDHLARSPDFQRWASYVDVLAGRWVLIVDGPETTTLFTDPMGLRQVFYTDVSAGHDTWCATQPGILADALKLGMDPVAVTQYVASEPFHRWDEYLWPADTSPYREIRHLLPNHALDLRTGACSRYWPNRPLATLSLQDSVEGTASLLKGLLKAASSRFALAHAISAGWDSRLLLAASKDICRNVYYFTYSRGVANADVTITPRLLSRLGLEDHVVTVPTRMSDEFADVFQENVTLARPFCGRFIEALHVAYPQGRVCLTGNAAEIVRVRFRLPPGESTLTPRHLARFMSFHFADQLEKIPFIVLAWERWLSGLGDTYNVNPLDVFYWEHWAGNFAGMDQTEGDMVTDTFTPFSCRRLLTTMLSADEAFRDHDLPILYRDTARMLWPEVLDEPVNPPPKRSLAARVSGRLRRVFGRRTGSH